MANPFVDYLNTLHNEKGSNQNAIAEMQVDSPYFAEMQVKRDIIAFLKEKLEAGQFVILTGHAGDGKTTLLAQVLAAFGVPVGKLCARADIEAPVSLHYVKDFSELTQKEQDAELQNCLKRKGASILIANTGPMLNAFKRLLGDGCEGELLNAMDASVGSFFSVPEDGKVFILNVARVDNTDFVRPFLDNIIDPRHWEACAQCPCAERCPILFNRNAVEQMREHVGRFIEYCYTWLLEYDMRATIRQITAHLAFSMTGGLSCRNVSRQGRQEWLGIFLFSNLFFGANGAADHKAAEQIRCVSLMRKAGFDQKNTTVDYDLYVRDELETYFPPFISEMFRQLQLHQSRSSSLNMQMILKRAYLFFGVNDAAQEKAFLQSIFSEWFEVYLGIRAGKKPSSKLRDMICQAINQLFVGDSLAGDTNNINLTLRRNNEQVSNVQILRGSIFVDDVTLVAAPRETIHRNRPLYQLELRVRRLKYPISLPLLNYFSEIQKGAITTDIDPLLSNGIDNLKAQLLSDFSAVNDDDEVTLVYLSGSAWKKRKLTIGPHSIDH